MRQRPATYLLVSALGLSASAAAQTPLTLTEAIARARAQNPDAGSFAPWTKWTTPPSWPRSPWWRPFCPWPSFGGLMGPYTRPTLVAREDVPIVLRLPRADRSLEAMQSLRLSGIRPVAISPMAGEVASLLLSRMAVPVLYYMAKRRERIDESTAAAPMEVA